MKKKYDIFILGCERSGSTWLLNILSCHGKILTAMEPFAKQLGLFPDFPHRNHYVSRLDKEYCQQVEKKLGELDTYQYPLLYRPGKPTFLYKLDGLILRLIKGIFLTTSAKLPIWIRRYTDLSLHMHRPNSGEIYSKDARESVALNLIKELRLNFKIPFLTHLYPDARYIVTIRHPAAQIHSILDRMHLGSLAETKDALALLHECAQHRRFFRYQNLTKNWALKSIEYQLVVWWLINYEVLIEDLKSSGVAHVLVYHEEISHHVDSVTNEIFSFIGIKKDENVAEYIDRSSKTQTQKNHDTLDTHRVSKIYYQQRIEQASADIKWAIDEVFSQLTPIPELSIYHEKTASKMELA